MFNALHLCDNEIAVSTCVVTFSIIRQLTGKEITNFISLVGSITNDISFRSIEIFMSRSYSVQICNYIQIEFI